MIFQASGLLFDNDGVLVDSMGSVDGSWGEWAKTYAPGFKLTYAHHGRPASEIVRDLVTEDLFQEALNEINRLELELTKTTKRMPGARELLAQLQPGTWTVVTSAGRQLGEGRLQAAGLPVPAQLVSADDVINGKPNPEPYIRGAAKLGIPIAECVVFEDAPSGIRAGIEAGAFAVIGVGQAAMETDANVVVSSLEGIRFSTGELEIPDSNRLR